MGERFFQSVLLFSEVFTTPKADSRFCVSIKYSDSDAAAGTRPYK